MTKEFVPYELAVKLKQLGFNEPCFFAFDNCSHPMRCSDLRTNEQKFDGVNYNSSSYTSQPTFSQAFRWFREEYGLLTYIGSRTLDNGDIIYIPNGRTIPDTVKNGFIVDNLTYATKKTYEEAELACLDKLIEIVETKQQ